jgi:DNA adenine methylase
MTALIRPFLKWPGGKRLLAKQIAGYVPAHFGTYFEPFVGGAALFFSLMPKRAVLADVNGELVNVYTQLRDRSAGILTKLRRLRISRAAFYRIRESTPTDAIDRAVRFLYLNRTAFNGIYRVNRMGHFNVPFGCKPGTVLCDADALTKASLALRNVDLRCDDFAESFCLAKQGDVIYADPPYTTMHDKNGFRRYNDAIFSWSDQERLAHVATEAARRGVTVLVSNANHSDVKRLYPTFTVVPLSRASCIAGNASARRAVTELLLVSPKMR